jgi:2'-5' RNA ligase
VPRLRLASALLVPEPFAREIDGLRRALGENLDRVAPHLTLVPPVNVRVDEFAAALSALRRAAAVMEPIAVTLGPAVTFHPVNPVVYLEVGGDVDAVRKVRDAVFVPPLERSMSHTFVPHVTVVESTRPERIEAALVALADYRIDVTFDAAHLLQEHDRRWRPIADARFAPPLVVGRGGIETEITVSSLADPHVTEFAGELRPDIEDVAVARRDGEIVAVGYARRGRLHRVVGDPDLERHLLRAVEASGGTLVGEPPLAADDRGEREREELA